MVTGLLSGLLAGALSLAAPISSGAGAEAAPVPTLESKTAGMSRLDGFLTLHLDRAGGRVWLELPASVGAADGLPVLVSGGLTSGLGSNPIGLDRSLLVETQYAVFRRFGDRVLLEQPNLAYRAGSDEAAERLAVRQSFATSVLWGFKVAARSDDGRLLVDLTPYLLRDAVGVARAIEAAGQGTYVLDPDRSAVDLEAVHAFPDNLEFDALLTFAGSKPGPMVRETAPAGESVSLVAHQSFVRPPDPGYTPRPFDPRAGSYPIAFRDYAAPLDQPIDRRWIVRHRLEAIDPGAARSRVRRPIVYYVDRGVPEPVRSALVEGASWWAQAFEEAGFIDAFRVELLPEGAHPLDVRYNVINWVHRSTRGWSYGSGMVDPRTGEMIKGHVLLGSLRVRHDRLLFEGLAGTAKSGSGSPDDPVVLALARIRQLSAHEVGHALGFAHNFAASTFNRGSVMDYPAPYVTARADGSLDFSSAYAAGIGSWDRLAVRCAYGRFAPGQDDAAAIGRLLEEGRLKGLFFLTDEDARPAGASHPSANLWDNGSDPVAEMERVLRVRRIALDRFGQDAVAPGRPLALLHEALIPVYFHHRYQLDAVAKVVGGMEYGYSLRGDGQRPGRMIEPERQRRALAVILRLLDPVELDLPERILELLVPRPPGLGPTLETLQARTDPAFDALGLAGTAAVAAVGALLQPERAARLVDFHRRDQSMPGLGEVLDALIEKGIPARSTVPARLGPIAGTIRQAVADGILALASDARAPALVRAEAERALSRLHARLSGASSPGRPPLDALIAADVERFLKRGLRDLPVSPPAPPMPPGSPIGQAYPPGLLLTGCSLDPD